MPPKKKYMSEDNQIQLFQGQQVRYIWDEEKEQYFFSVVDVIQVLTDSTTPRRYWSDLKRKLQAEGSEVYEKIVQLKLPAPDGKMRLFYEAWSDLFNSSAKADELRGNNSSAAETKIA